MCFWLPCEVVDGAPFLVPVAVGEDGTVGLPREVGREQSDGFLYARVYRVYGYRIATNEVEVGLLPGQYQVLSLPEDSPARKVIWPAEVRYWQQCVFRNCWGLRKPTRAEFGRALETVRALSNAIGEPISGRQIDHWRSY